MYKKHKGHLKRVDPVLVRLAKDNSKCRHEFLCEAYLVAHSTISPLHNCCDVCDKKVNVNKVSVHILRDLF